MLLNILLFEFLVLLIVITAVTMYVMLICFKVLMQSLVELMITMNVIYYVSFSRTLFIIFSLIIFLHLSELFCFI